MQTYSYDLFGVNLFCKRLKYVEHPEVVGVIVDAAKSVRIGRRSRSSYKMLVAFKTKAEQPIIHEYTVSSSFFHKHVQGDEISDPNVEVRYLKDSPETNELVGDASSPILMYGIGIGMTLIGCIGSAVLILGKVAL